MAKGPRKGARFRSSSAMEMREKPACRAAYQPGWLRIMKTEKRERIVARWFVKVLAPRAQRAGATWAQSNGLSASFQPCFFVTFFLDGFFVAAFFVERFFFFFGLPLAARSANKTTAWSKVKSSGLVPFGSDALVSPSVT